MTFKENKKVGAAHGFTLIELLVVIAVIAILAALLFPVFGIVRENVRKGTCMSQLHEIYVAVQQYKLDNNRYPATLYDYVEIPGGAYYTGSGSPVPMGAATQRPLYKQTGGKYLKDVALFYCPDNTPVNQTAVTTAIFPVGPQVTAVGQVPNYYNAANPAYFYVADSYDVGPKVDNKGNPVLSGGNPVMEVHYSLSWTNTSGPGDNPNQLKYPDPQADQTVVTWCTYHVAVAHSNIIPVLMLSGNVRAVTVDKMVNQGPLTFKF